MSKLFKSLLLSAAVAVVCAAPIAPPPAHDPCAVLGASLADPATTTTMPQVAACYKSIPFDPNQAGVTLDSLYTLYDEFFIFRDSAMTPNLPLPFTQPPVDVLAGINQLRTKKYTTDYDFHADLALLAKSLNDAHVTYLPTCYNSFTFQQQFFLYAPVLNGQQSIRIFQDLTGGNREDCVVTQINGEDATTYLQKWADKNTGFSKDAGVRLNNVLASQQYFPATKTWGPVGGAFAETAVLPEAESLTYNVQCPGKAAETVQVKWVVAGVPTTPFTDRASYLRTRCLTPPKQQAPTHTPGTGPAPAPGPGNLIKDFGPRHQKPVIENELLIKFRDEQNLRQYAEKEFMLKKRGVDVPVHDMDDATLIDGDVTAVYQLKSNVRVGILVVPTMDVTTSTEIPAVQRRLAMLASAGVTHIIIDTFGNGGGDVAFSSLLASVFFPPAEKLTNAHLARFRDSPAATALAAADLLNRASTYFDPETLGNATTGLPIRTNFFTSPVSFTRNGREAQYTEEFFMDYSTRVLGNINYPGKNDPTKIVILTDGQCGSACGMTSELFVNKHGVKAVAVGGYHGKDLSMFSFAGASVLGHDAIVDTFEELGVPSVMERLPYRNTVNIGVIEVYSGTDTTPLEYNPLRYVAAHRLDYTPETARSHSRLWAAVAKLAWGM
ncbi:hypothetical protein BGX34_007552 [Mortierella sp. NVP85]|nr:hypothetical protein BGX34_007552 [Mortierella sp. NVP85]